MKFSSKQIIDIAVKTLTIEANALLEIKKTINEDFVTIIQKILRSKGRVVVSGIGKSAIIASKIVSTFNSTGTPAMFLHAADAIHGDLGMAQENDIMICISKSGESPEIKVLVPLIKNNGNLLIGMVGNMNSFLASHADLVLNTTVPQEACPNNLAPTSSTTAQMAMGDALAVCLLKLRGFSPEDFAKFHPGGTLGKKLYLRVSDLYARHPRPFVREEDSLHKVIVEITSNRLGATAVLNKRNGVSGVITDGDIRRTMEKNFSIEKLIARDIMGKNPRTISKDELAVDALEMMRKNKITQVIVMDKKKYAGMVHVHDLLKEGLL